MWGRAARDNRDWTLGALQQGVRHRADLLPVPRSAGPTPRLRARVAAHRHPRRLFLGASDLPGADARAQDSLKRSKMTALLFLKAVATDPSA